MLSGKKKLAVDDEVIVQKNNSIAVFNYSFQLDSVFPDNTLLHYRLQRLRL